MSSLRWRGRRTLFKPEIFADRTIGFSFETDEAYFFFGTRHGDRATLKEYFPQYEFAYLKQVHGRAVVLADAGIETEADAHYTSKKNLALVSQSADCTPILLANREVACAIHSGWRGTAQNIVAASRVAFAPRSPSAAAIGPHIMKASFEVGLDVASQLSAVLPGGAELEGTHPDPLKKYFDLTELVRRQLRETFGSDLEIHEQLSDTVADELYFSFRRDKQRAGRQYSFVVLKA